MSGATAPSTIGAASKRRSATNRVMLALCLVCGVIVLIPLFAVVAYVVIKAVPNLSIEEFTKIPQTQGDLPNSITGTVLLIILACAVGLPIGVLSGVYLAEYGRGRLATTVRFLCDVMAGLPSIVAGLVAYGLIVVTTGGFSALSGGVALGLLMFPTVARTTEAVLILVPASLREAGLALGLPHWRVILRVALPTAAGGVATAIILGIARVAGETAPLFFTAFGSNDISFNPMRPVNSLPWAIWQDSQAPDPQSQAVGWVGALVLVALVLFLNLLARLLSRRWGGLRTG